MLQQKGKPLMLLPKDIIKDQEDYHRCRYRDVALREIVFYQKTYSLLMSQLPFDRYHVP